MKLIAAFAFAILPSFAGVQPQTARVIGDGSFTVTMPSNPEKKVIPVAVKAGSGSEIRYSSQKDGVAFLFDYTDYSFTPDPDYRKLRDNFIEGIGGGKIVEQSEIALEGHSGYTFKVETADFTVIHRMFMCGDRLYQLAVALPRGTAIPQDAAEFFDSFKLN